MKLVKCMIVAAVVLFVLMVCTKGNGNRTPLGDDVEVTATVVKEKVSLAHGRTGKIFQLECQGNKNILIVVGKVDSTDFTHSLTMKINNLPVLFNPALKNDQIFLFVANPAAGGLTCPVNGLSVESLTKMAATGRISTKKLDLILRSAS